MNHIDSARRAARAPRLKVFQPIDLDCGSGPVRAHLLDLSRSGALIHCSGAPDKGAAIWISLGETRNRARVIWRDGKRFGAEFAGKLSDAQIDEVLAAQIVLAAPRAVRPPAHAACAPG